MPRDGHEFCPLMAMGSAQLLAITDRVAQANGLTSRPARAWDRRTLSPLV